MDALSVWAALDPDGPPEVRWVRPVPGPMPVLLLGAFDPPTRAHLALVEGASRHTGRSGALCLTKLLLDRSAGMLLSPEQRVELLDALAVEGGLGLCLANRGTYLEVALALDGQAVFVVGSDKLAQLADPSFYPDGSEGVRATFEQARFCVVPRGGAAVDRSDVEVIDEQAVFGATDLALISASDVRRRLSEGMPIDELVPPLVARRLEGYNRDPSRRR